MHYPLLLQHNSPMKGSGLKKSMLWSQSKDNKINILEETHEVYTNLYTFKRTI